MYNIHIMVFEKLENTLILSYSYITTTVMGKYTSYIEKDRAITGKDSEMHI